MAQKSNSPYDFILDSEVKKKSSLPLPDSSSKKGRIFIILGLLAVLIIGFVVISNLISSANKTDAAGLTNIAKTQSEIIRLATLSKYELHDTALINYSQSIIGVVDTDQRLLISYLTKLNIKLGSKTLSSGKNPKNDTLLDEAKHNNNYDGVYLPFIKKQLRNYQNLLQAQYQKAKTNTEKKLLDDSHSHVTLLLDTLK